MSNLKIPNSWVFGQNFLATSVLANCKFINLEQVSTYYFAAIAIALTISKVIVSSTIGFAEIYLAIPSNL